MICALALLLCGNLIDESPNHVLTIKIPESADARIMDALINDLESAGASGIEVFENGDKVEIVYYSDVAPADLELILQKSYLESDFGGGIDRDLVLDITLIDADLPTTSGCEGVLLSTSSNEQGRSYSDQHIAALFISSSRPNIYVTAVETVISHCQFKFYTNDLSGLPDSRAGPVS